MRRAPSTSSTCARRHTASSTCSKVRSDARMQPADNRAQERMLPTGYDAVVGDSAYPEAEMVAQRLKPMDTTVQYLRIPVTDHCAPSDTAVDKLCGLRDEARKDPRSWVHFHCHGGDGRTTTFLTLYDPL